MGDYGTLAEGTNGRVMIPNVQLRVPPSSFAPSVLLEEVVLPAFARAGDEEPVVVEAHLVASHIVVSIAVGRRGGGLALAPGQKGAVILKHGRQE